ncbi:hypothetical protein EBS67_09210, partial [bacterium]|nr:hypothetical protein [bacterium]
TADQLQVILGKPPRTKKVVMCHGVFDVVHPGHIRHFLFAKSKAPTLVVSLTSDAHINKGTYRPHIPEELRAINLAALEIVDFVIIDHNETPLDNLKFIRPDLFAKGYEYSSDNTANLKTQQEVSVVESYGGEFIFTPGDFVFSSSRFIRDTPPNIRTEKLLLLMKQANLFFINSPNLLKKLLTMENDGDHFFKKLQRLIPPEKMYPKCAWLNSYINNLVYIP